MTKKDKTKKKRMKWVDVIYYVASCLVLLGGIFFHNYIYSLVLRLLQQGYLDIVVPQNEKTQRFMVEPVANVISVTLLLAISIIVIYLISKPFRKTKALPSGFILVTKILAFSIATAAVLVWIYDNTVPFDPEKYGISAQSIYEIAHKTNLTAEEAEEVVTLIDAPSLSTTYKVGTPNIFDNICNSIKYFLMTKIPTAIEIGKAFVPIGAVWLFIAQEMISKYEIGISEERLERIERNHHEIENRQNNQQENEHKFIEKIDNLQEKSKKSKEQLDKIKQDNYEIKNRQNDQQKTNAELKEKIVALENDIRELKIKFEDH